MSGSRHEFDCTLEWAGEAREYKTYSRNHEVMFAGKVTLALSAATAFRGDGARHNPEDLLVAALSSCHFLSYLAECTRAGVVALEYRDEAHGTMAFDPARKVMAFTEVVLRPRVVIERGGDETLALRLHERAHHECFIANSVNFPVRNEAKVSSR